MGRLTIAAVLEAVEDFTDYEWCECSECRHVVGSHGADYHGTFENLKAYLLAEFPPTPPSGIAASTTRPTTPPPRNPPPPKPKSGNL